MSQESTLTAFSNKSLVITFSTIDPRLAEKVIRSGYAAGVRVFEFSEPDTISTTVFKQLLEDLSDLTGVTVGISNVIDEKVAESFIGAGVSYIGSPFFIDTVADECYQSKITYCPGCMTLKEVFAATQAGCEVIRIFPAEVLGVSFAKAVKAVFPAVRLLVSGVEFQTKDTFGEWFNAGVSSISIGSSVIKRELIETGNFSSIENDLRELISKHQ